jgi:hypothetical protein
MEPRHAVRGGLQAGFRGAGPIRKTEGRHQRVRGSVSVPGASVAETVSNRVMRRSSRRIAVGCASMKTPYPRDKKPGRKVGLQRFFLRGPIIYLFSAKP